MRKVLIVLLSLSLFVSCEKEQPKVLLFVTDGSRDLELMLTREVLAMKDLLEKSNLEVDIATLTGERISVDTVVVIPDFKLVNVNASEYEGYMFPCIPCIAPPWDKIYEPNKEVVSFIKEAYQEARPMASQTLSVADFAKAGILVNRKYAFTIDPDLDEYPEFQGGIYSGEGIIQDGLIITSGTCPWKTREYGKPDGTPKLTELFIQAVTTKQ
jgi:putative intracellular protease/amidase